MSRKEWGALAVILIAVTALQLLGPGGTGDHDAPEPAEHVRSAEAPGEVAPSSPASGEQEDMFRTVALEVRGMT